MKLSPTLFLFSWALLGAAPDRPEVSSLPEAARLPTGLRLDTVGTTSDLGNLPVKIVSAPGGRQLIVLLSGWREQGLQVVDRGSGRVVQTVPQAAAFFGLVFSPDGKALYASGGNEDVVYRYEWENSEARLDGELPLASKETGKDATRYPAGLAISPDGSRLYVAENLSDTLAVLDLPSGRVLQRLPTAHYPYDVVIGPDGAVFVSAWGASSVSAFRVAQRSTDSEGGLLAADGQIEVGRHPSGLLSNPSGERLFVACASTDSIAVIDTKKRRVLKTLLDPPPAGPREGSTPIRSRSRRTAVVCSSRRPTPTPLRFLTCRAVPPGRRAPGGGTVWPAASRSAGIRPASCSMAMRSSSSMERGAAQDPIPGWSSLR